MKLLIKWYYIILIYTWSFVDVITGFNLHSSNEINFNIAQVSRSLLLVFSLIIVFLNTRFYNKTILFFISTLFTLLFIKIFYYKFPFSFLYFNTKTFGWIINLLALYILFKSKIIIKKHFINALYINFIIIFLSICLSYFGYGFSKYGENSDGQIIGSIGFFYSGNELNSALFLIYSSFFYIYRNSFKKFITLGLIFFIVTISTLSKSIILGYIFIIVLTKNVYFANKINVKAKFYLLFLVVLIYYISINFNSFNSYLEGFNFIYERSDSFIEFISSGRNLRFEAFNSTNFFNNPLNILIGTYHPENPIYTFEMDYIDIFFYNGILGIILISLCWLLIYNLLKSNLNKNSKKYFIWVLIFYNVISFFAGHTLASQMSFLFLTIFITTSLFDTNLDLQLLDEKA